MKIIELNINENLKLALLEMGYTDLTDVQSKVLNPALEGKDMFVRSQTGSGKTMAFGIPVINNLNDNVGVQALIVCPTRELASQVTTELRRACKHLDRELVTPIFGGSAMSKQIKALKSGNTKIVVGTPGRIIDHLERGSLKLRNVSTLVLDEADEMLNMGFKEEIEKILTTMPGDRQTMLFSATYPQNIKLIANNYLKEPVKVEIGIENSSLKTIKQEYCQVKKGHKRDALLNIFKDRQPFLVIIFCNTKNQTTEIAHFLSDNKIEALALNGDMRQSERSRVMRDIKESKCSVLVATDVAARGIDIKDVDYVINFDIPNSNEYFLHRIGRTARAGKEGRAVSIVTNTNQLGRVKEIEEKTQSTIERYYMDEIDDNSFSKSKVKKVEATEHRKKNGSKNENSSRNNDRRQGSRDSKIFGKDSDRRERNSRNDRSQRNFDRNDRKLKAERSERSFDRKEKSFDRRDDRKSSRNSERSFDRNDRKPKTERSERSFDRKEKSFDRRDEKKSSRNSERNFDRNDRNSRNDRFSRNNRNEKSFDKKRKSDYTDADRKEKAMRKKQERDMVFGYNEFAKKEKKGFNKPKIKKENTFKLNKNKKNKK